MNYKYSTDISDDDSSKKMKEAAIQTAVQAIRFLENFKPTSNDETEKTLREID